MKREQGLLTKEQVARRAKSLAKSHLGAESWVEHLEEEMEPLTFDADLELLLQNSESDRALFESLKKTRSAVKASDDVALPESGQYYDQLHAKIMATISFEEGDLETSKNIPTAQTSQIPAALLQRSRPFAWPQVFGAIGMTMMLALVALMSLKSTGHKQVSETIAMDRHLEQTIDESDTRFERRLAMVDPRVGASIAHELGSFESEEDFLTETAAARLKKISARDATAMLEHLGH